MNRKLGMVVFSSNSGLGNQSRRLCQMLRPERILLIDNSSFSKNKEQHPEWYDGFSGYTCDGFPNNSAVNKFLPGLTHLYIIENPLNWHMVTRALQMRIKVYVASNYEFCDNLVKPHLPIPDLFLMPSYWMVKEMKEKFGEGTVKYLPPPVFHQEFKSARDYNLNIPKETKKRILHIIGTLAASDRNGTKILLEALKYTKSDFQLVIKSQHALPPEYQTDDPRVIWDIRDNTSVESMYHNFDFMILPRRFGGLCLPMQEALMSALPVIMPDISPNDEALPSKWLVPAEVEGEIVTRTPITLYAMNARSLAKKIDEMIDKDLDNDKLEAFDIAYNEFSPSQLEREYDLLWN